ncbi:MAG: DNA repair protein RecO [Chromatiaceae bacterium]|nr:DNA repair protein RecO [Chromatiaceae bacterium]
MGGSVAPEPLRRCFVLHRHDYGNTSLLLDLFCAETGRLPVLAKGAKRGRAPAAAILQPFRPLWANWTGRGEVRTLTSAEPAGRALELGGQAIFCGFYLNELLTRLLGRGIPHPALFAFYHAALAGLAAGEPLETRLRQFELRLLGEIGYGPQLDQDERGPVAPEARYRCAAGQPPRRVLAGEGGAQSISGATLLALATGEPMDDDQQTREARHLLHSLLAPHLGPKPLKSRELFRQAKGNPGKMPN